MFPRGGSLRLVPEESKGGAASASGDAVLFSNQGVKSKKKTKRSKVKSGEGVSELDVLERQMKKRQKLSSDDGGSNVGVESATFRAKRAFKLVRKSLQEGTLCMGVVSKVSDSKATISLDNGLFGRIGVADLSDEHANGSSECEDSVSAYLTLGQRVVCAIVQKSDENREIRLSLAASLINQHVGSSRVAYGTIRSVEDHGYLVNLGGKGQGFLEFSKEEKKDEDKRRLVGGSVELELAKDGKVEARSGVTRNLDKLEQLLPNMTVEGRIVKHLEDGVVVEFLGFLSGTVGRLHLDSEYDLEGTVSSREKQVFTVIFVDRESKRIGLSCVSPVPRKVLEVSERLVGRNFSDAVVKRVDKGAGVLLEIPDSSLPAYARIDVKGGEETVKQVDEKHKVGQVVTCRVLKVSPVQGMMSVSLAKSVIQASVLSYSDIEVGAKVRGTVRRVGDHYITVSLSDTVHGKIPSRHLADVLISDVGARFKPGQSLDNLVVLSCQDNKLMLTNKRSLANSELGRITCFEDAQPGLVTHGVISGSDASKGVFVTFFGDISGRVDRSDLLALGIDDPSTVYKIGATVKVKVSRVNKAKRQIALSVRPAAAASVSNHIQKNGTIVTGRVLSKDPSKVVVQVDDEAKSIMSVPVSQQGGKKLKKSTTLDLLVLDGENGILSANPALIQAVEENKCPNSFDQVAAGTTLIGYCQNVNQMGVFVQFCGITGLAPRANVADGFVDDPTEHFKKGQTLLATVCQVDPDNERMIVSLKPSDLEIDESWYKLFLPFQNKQFACGQVLENPTVVKKTDQEVVLKYQSHQLLCPLEHWSDNAKQVRVLDPISKTVTAKASFEASTVQLVMPSYVVLTCEDDNFCLAPTCSFNGPIAGLRPYYKVGDKVNCSLAKDFKHVGILERQQQLVSKKRNRARSRGASMDWTPQDIVVGATITGQVRDKKGAWISVGIKPVENDVNRRMHGQIHMTNIQAEPGTNALDKYSVGDIVQAKVIAMEDKVDAKGKSITNVMLAPQQNAYTLESLEVGKVYLAFVDHAVHDGVHLAISKNARGFCYCTHFSRDVSLLDKLFNKEDHSNLLTGNVVNVVVLSKANNHVRLSAIL